MVLSYSKYSAVIVVGTRTHCDYFVVLPLCTALTVEKLIAVSSFYCHVGLLKY